MRVRDLRVLEGAHDVHDRVHVADVAEEPVAEALPLVGAAHEPRDVDHLEMLGDAARDAEQVAHLLEARVRHRHDRDVRLDRRERILGGLGARASERVEERRLARVRQAHDADFHEAASSVSAITVPTRRSRDDVGGIVDAEVGAGERHQRGCRQQGAAARGTRAPIRTAPANDVAACADGNERDRGTRPNGSSPRSAAARAALPASARS